MKMFKVTIFVEAYDKEQAEDLAAELLNKGGQAHEVIEVNQ